MTCSNTFKEDKFPVFSFISSIDSCRETSKEMSNWHGVIFQHPLMSDTPEPLILKERGGIMYIKHFIRMCVPLLKYTNIQNYLKHKHFSPEDGNGVKIALTDIRTKGRFFWSIWCRVRFVMWRVGAHGWSWRASGVWSCRAQRQ